MAIKQDAAFEAFVSTSQSMLGSDLSRDWLFEIWVGADADANRALNHVLDSPEDKIRRTGGGGTKSSGDSKPKKSKPPKESKPAPATPATTWGDDDWSPPPAPAPVHQAPPAPTPQQAPPPQQQQPMQYQQQPMQYQQQPMMMQQSQAMMMQQPQSMMMPQPSQPMMMPQPTQPMMMMPQQSQPMMFDPMTGLPIAQMNPIQQAQTMFVQQQQQQRLMALKASIDSVLTNPVMMMNPQIMQNLQDTMIMALEAPNATLQLAERARQSQQTAQFIHIMQSQVAQMLADPKVATNPALLQQLNTQMNQLRLLTMQHVAQQQIDSNPASVLSLSMPLITPANPSAALLSRAMLGGSQQRLDDYMGIAQGLPLSREISTEAAIAGAASGNEDWWNTTPKARSGTLSEKNPFRDDSESTTVTPVNSARRLRSSMPSLAGMPVMGGGMYGASAPFGMSGPLAPMYSMPNMMGGYPQMTGMTPLSLMYGSQQAGYNPLLAMQQQTNPYLGMGPAGYPPQSFSRMI